MEILAIIPARGGSKGIPLKNLTKINGKPLIFYSVNASLKSKSISRTIVSTDSKKIANYAKKCGAEVIMRPKKLATDSAKIEPVMEHILEKLQEERYIPEVIVLLQPTSPLRTAQHVDKAIDLLYKKNMIQY